MMSSLIAQQQRVRAGAANDQAWKDLDTYIADLDRICEHDVNGSKRDLQIITKALYTVCGELHLRRYDVEDACGKDDG